MTAAQVQLRCQHSRATLAPPLLHHFLNTATQRPIPTPTLPKRFPYEDECELEPSPVLDQFELYTAKGFANVVPLDPHGNSHASDVPKQWESLWEPDFKKLLGSVSGLELADVIAVSQLDKNKQYYIRPAKLIENLSMLREMVEELGSKLMPSIRKNFRAKIRQLEDKYPRGVS